MPNRRSVREAALAAAMAGGLLAATSVALPAPAHAAPPDEHGYWWRVPLAAASRAPEGGLWVAVDPTGPQAVSAVRFRTAAGEEAAALVLEIDSSDGMAPAIVACPASTPWDAPDGAGAWADAPEASCDAAQAEGVVDEDAGTWTFDLDALAVDGDVDVVLAAAPGSGAFSVTFLPPGEHSVVTSAAAPSTGAGGDAGDAAAPPAPAGRPPSTASAGDFAPPAATPAFTPAPMGASALPFESDPPAAVPPPRQVPPAGAAPPTERSEGGSREPLALLAALLVCGAWVGRSRFAVAAAESHPLAAPFAGAIGDGTRSRLAEAGSLLAADAAGAASLAGPPSLEVEP